MTTHALSQNLARCCSAPVRVLIVPGLHNSGQAHWQTVLQQRHGRRAVRVQQRDWAVADLSVWADRVAQTVAQEPPGRWVAVAHSFGCLALMRALVRGLPGVESLVLVAPADPAKFAVGDLLPVQPLPVQGRLVASRTDPWMPFASARHWSGVWGCKLIDLGDAGHVNSESGHGPWPLGQQIVERELQRLHRRTRLADPPEHSSGPEFQYRLDADSCCTTAMKRSTSSQVL